MVTRITTEEGKTERTSMEMMSNFCSFVQTRVTKLNKNKIVSVQQSHLTRTVLNEIQETDTERVLPKEVD